MTVTPAKLLKGTMATSGPANRITSSVFDADSIWYGYPREWEVTLTLEPQPMGTQQLDGSFSFTTADIKVGDWVASSAGGIAVRIAQILSVTDSATISVVVEDEDNYNIYSDPTAAGASIGPDGPCVVFEVDVKSGLPVLTPMPLFVLDVTTQTDILSRFIHLQKLKLGTIGTGTGGGGSDVLTDTTDGTYSDGYIQGWQVGATKVADAFRALNLAIKDVLPPAPPSLDLQYLNIEGGLSLVDGNPIVLAVGALNSTGLNPADMPAPGTPIRRVLKSTFNTTEIGPFGPGNRGDLSLVLNGDALGTAQLDVGSDVGSYGELEITTDLAYPSGQPGFHEALTARGVAMVPVEGVNYAQITHSGGTASVREFFVYNKDNILPTISNVFVDIAESSVLAFSSGIPHLARGSSLIVGGTVQDLATDITFDRRNIDILTSPVEVGPTTWLSPGSKGLKSGFVKGGTDTFANANYDIADTLNNPAYGSVDLKVVARNPNGSSEFVYPRKINVMRGGVPTGLGPLDENNIPVEQLGDLVEGKPLFGFRVALPNTFAPDGDFLTMPPLWDSTVPIVEHEASVVGGAAVADLVDYSNYIPPGPNYSAKYGTQYITFALCRSAVSSMIVQVRGSFSNMLVKLPGLTDLPLSVNGWWDASVAYEGAGTPGRGISAGCALGTPAFGFDQDVKVTFGAESSAFSNNNLILVRFVLTGTNKITGLRFSGVV
jgi:hypothetical protein